MEKKKKIIVTGASGFVGINFIEKYSDRYDIVPISLRTTKVEDIDFKDIDCVLHLAALVHQMKGAPEEKYFEINRDLTEKLAVRAKENGVRHFVFYSTVKVYGYDGDLYNHNFVLDINSECKPNDPYGQSKYEAEEILRQLEGKSSEEEQVTSDVFQVMCIRPPMIYGAGVKGNMTNLVKLVKKFPILPFNYNENKRSIVSINNLLELTKKVIDKEERGIYIPTDGEAVSIKQMVEGIGEGLDKKVILIKFPDFIYKLLCKVKPNIMVRLYGSLQFKGNNQPVESMKDGLRGMIGGVKE
ncbi:MAG: NAD-dependent epimerase/dehydratase family protein [Psychrilyobacter sp.]|uniref:NAD-dependent epimerase/dehydratase family protein n=1 Tax=Psychrilyobacter sp. TaxID=2586924 RepID=UPI003C71A306